MCKHDRLAVSRVVFPDSMEIKRVFCLNCGKTKTEIDLEQLLTAEKAKRERAEARIAELNMVLNENAVKCIKCLSVQKAALHKSETFREQAELDSERATAKWLQAEARISTLSTQLSETSTNLQNVEGAKEGAEAQCAAMQSVVTFAREYDTICTQIHAMTEPIPGYMLDVARRARMGMHEALARLDANLPRCATTEQGAPATEHCPNPSKTRMIKINGHAEVTVSHEEFMDKFIAFVEANGWTFGGATDEVKP